MEASLTIPTATSVRSGARAHARGEPRASSTSTATAPRPSKISFTHLVAWAILRALDSVPAPERRATRSWRASPTASSATPCGSGIAVDVQKKDGSRTLLVPNIKDARQLGLRGSS